MQVGETMTLRLPSNITSLALRGVQWVSTRPNEIQVVSQTTYSATIKVLKAVPSTTTCLVNCRYYYLVNNGGYIYQLTGSYDFKVETMSNEPTSVSLPLSVTLNIGESKSLTAILTPHDAQTELTWASSNYATINVFQNGRILAQKEGTSIITVRTSNGRTATCTVNAIKPTIDATSVSISSVTCTIKVGEKNKLNAVVFPSNATNKQITWVSSNPSIVSVDKNGNIIGLKAGTANISVMTNNGKTASCTVNCIAMIPDLEISDKNGMSEIPAVANVRYDRIMYSGWNSVCVPFALDKTILDGFLEGFRMALVETFEIVGDKQFVTIKEVCFVEAGVPCLIYAPSEV
ncbi:Ig-like domain-containing protein, partial [Bacteroides salyersiae]